MKKTPPMQRLMEKVVLPMYGQSNECWGWAGSLSSNGYAAFWYKGRVSKASVASWELHNGPIPEGLHVLHKCDNRKCARPSHLFLGTHQENMADMKTKGRATCGEKSNLSRLTGATVAEIRANQEGLPWRQVAIKYGIARSTLRDIRKGITWKKATK